MIRIQSAKQDILPITAFRTQLASILKRLEERNHPVILTHNGRATAVLLNIEAYEQLVSDLELAKGAVESLMQIAKGEMEGVEGVKFKKEGKK